MLQEIVSEANGRFTLSNILDILDKLRRIYILIIKKQVIKELIWIFMIKFTKE